MTILIVFHLISLAAPQCGAVTRGGRIIRHERQSHADVVGHARAGLPSNRTPDKFIYNNELEQVWGSGNHCRLHHALDDRWKNEIVFAATGGSATSGAGHVGVNNSWFNALGRMLGGNMSVNNAANGGTNSFWSAMFLDSVVGDADVLFWEYALNDALGGSTGFPATNPEIMEQELEFWLRRASRLRNQPSLVFVYLYDAASIRVTPANKSFISSALEAGAETLKRYAAEGLDILVIPVGPLMRDKGEKAIAPGDNHHPSKELHLKIAEYVKKHLFAAADSSKNCDVVNRVPYRENAAMRPLGGTFEKSQTLRRLATMDRVSLTINEPVFTKQSNMPLTLTVCSENRSCQDAGRVNVGKIDKARVDRKNAFVLPTCTQSGLEDHLRAEDVKMERFLTLGVSDERICSKAKFIALSIRRGAYNHHPWTSEIAVQVRGQKHILNKKVPNETKRELFYADGNIDDIASIPDTYRLRLNEFVDLENAWSLLDFSASDTKQILFDSCELISFCAVRLYDDSSREGIVEDLAVFY